MASTSAGFIGHIGDIDVLLTDHCGKLIQHIGNIFMENCNSSGLTAYAHIAGRIIYAVANIAVLQIIHQFFHSHLRTVILGFLGACAQMRDHDTAGLSCCRRIREIRYITGYLATL
jgi:hypothetical protein